MKQLILPAAAFLLLVALPLFICRLMDDPLERHVEPLIGAWRSRLDHGTKLCIRIDAGGGGITVHHIRERYAMTYALRYDDCLHYLDTDGNRVDIFHSSEADVLLLMPGGTFRRIDDETP